MDKIQLLQFLETLDVDREEFWILSSGALVLRGIYPTACDLDIAVTDKGFLQIQKNYNIKYKDNGWFIISDMIEGVCNGAKECLKYLPEMVDGYYVQNINEYYEYLCSSDREKDKARIPIVEEYMKNS